MESALTLDVKRRAGELFSQHRQSIFHYTDRLFTGLMLFQWLGGILLALWVSPRAWEGEVSSVHLHVWAAVLLGGLIALPAIWLGIHHAGESLTRYVVSASQMLFSALLIHLTGGRIETHFHVFGSLAFLAFYRDWKVLMPAAAVVAVDHWVRGVYWPMSVYGVVLASPWRWIEHTAWVAFECVFLIAACRRSVREMWNIAQQTAQLEASHQAVEEEVLNRTAELVRSNEALRAEVEERKRLELAVVHSEKMAAVGQIATDAAQEINSPIDFIHSNLETLEGYMKRYSKLAQAMNQLKHVVASGDMKQARALVDDIQKKFDLDSVAKDVDIILRESSAGTERIRKIIWELRSSSRAEMADNIELTRLEDIIEEVLNMIRPEIEAKAQLRVQLGATPRLCLNSRKMGQVFLNLLLNAVQAVDQNGSIEIRTYSQGDQVFADVKDSGRGMDAQMLAKISGIFLGARHAGITSGLGLSVSYDIVKKYGGDIHVKSQPGKGSTFTVMLPAI